MQLNTTRGYSANHFSVFITCGPACLIHQCLPELLHRHVVAQVEFLRLTRRKDNLDWHFICFDSVDPLRLNLLRVKSEEVPVFIKCSVSALRGGLPLLFSSCTSHDSLKRNIKASLECTSHLCDQEKRLFCIVNLTKHLCFITLCLILAALKHNFSLKMQFYNLKFDLHNSKICKKWRSVDTFDCSS